jgi:hypothetical protein
MRLKSKVREERGVEVIEFTYESAAAAVARTTGSFEYRVSAGTCAGEGSIVRVRVRMKIPMVDIPFVPLPQLWTDHTANARCEARF